MQGEAGRVRQGEAGRSEKSEAGRGRQKLGSPLRQARKSQEAG
jgi:hypothetical protein